jgi:carbon storage regulator
MLVLSRKRWEGLRIGPDIRITIVKVDRGLVRLGIEAPGDISVLREELLLDPEDRAARHAWQQDDTDAAEETTDD